MKRQATVSKQSEFIKAEEELKLQTRNKGLKKQRDANEDRDITADPATSAESLESIGDFFDATMKPSDTHITNPGEYLVCIVYCFHHIHTQ